MTPLVDRVLSAMGSPPCSEVDALRSEVERLERERDEARAEVEKWRSWFGPDVSDVVTGPS